MEKINNYDEVRIRIEDRSRMEHIVKLIHPYISSYDDATIERWVHALSIIDNVSYEEKNTELRHNISYVVQITADALYDLGWNEVCRYGRYRTELIDIIASYIKKSYTAMLLLLTSPRRITTGILSNLTHLSRSVLVNESDIYTTISAFANNDYIPKDIFLDIAWEVLSEHGNPVLLIPSYKHMSNDLKIDLLIDYIRAIVDKGMIENVSIQMLSNSYIFELIDQNTRIDWTNFKDPTDFSTYIDNQTNLIYKIQEYMVEVIQVIFLNKTKITNSTITSGLINYISSDPGYTFGVYNYISNGFVENYLNLVLTEIYRVKSHGFDFAVTDTDYNKQFSMLLKIFKRLYVLDRFINN